MEGSPPPSSPFEIHPKVGIPLFVGSLVAFTLNVAKARWGIDLTAESANLIVIVTFIVGYLTPGA